MTANTSEPSGPAEFVIRRVGVVGLGHMGHAFAVNLVADGHQVFAYDRDPKRAATLTGASADARLADLAACDVVVTSLPDDDARAAVAHLDRPRNRYPRGDQHKMIDRSQRRSSGKFLLLGQCR